jgi:RNA polymerase primary sigma factor
MQQATEGRSKGYFRSSPSTAFDQYLHDIQRLPLINDPAEERRLARRAQRGDEQAAERLVTANLRFVISYVKKYQGHGLDLGELVAIGNEGLLKAVRKFDPTRASSSSRTPCGGCARPVLKALAEQTRRCRIPLNQNSQLIRLAAPRRSSPRSSSAIPPDHELGRLLDENARRRARGQADVVHRGLARRAHRPLGPRRPVARRAFAVPDAGRSRT